MWFVTRRWGACLSSYSAPSELLILWPQALDTEKSSCEKQQYPFNARWYVQQKTGTCNSVCLLVALRPSLLAASRMARRFKRLGLHDKLRTASSDLCREGGRWTRGSTHHGEPFRDRASTPLRWAPQSSARDHVGRLAASLARGNFPGEPRSIDAFPAGGLSNERLTNFAHIYCRPRPTCL